LYDPLDGRKICNVEGLELVRKLAGPEDDGIRKEGLKAEQLEQGTTVLSRKIFCYQAPNEPLKLLSSIKLRPNSPKRPIPTTQAVALYDTATTYFTHANKLVLHTEFPNGKCYWATAESPPGKTDPIPRTKSFDFTVYTRQRPTDLPELPQESSMGEIVVSPKRSKIIQFGASPKQDDARFGARETYSYTFPQSYTKRSWRFWEPPQEQPPNACTVKYIRYGEGPPWYGPGKYCALELQGRRIQSVEDLSPLSATVAAQIPGFMAVHGPIRSNDDARDAVSWFRKQGLQLRDGKRENQGVKGRAFHSWNRLRAASRHSPGTSSS
jgi:hypothetical protein